MNFSDFLSKEVFNFMTVKQLIYILLITLVTAVYSFSTNLSLWSKIAPVLCMCVVSLIVVYSLNYGPIIMWRD